MIVGVWNDSLNFPNLCSMKLSAYHKGKGDFVERWNPDTQYDLVYASKVFTESKEPLDFHAVEIIKGGSGYDLNNRLSDEIEHIYPDYELYPDFHAALGVLTRGCPRVNHGFCITPKKDGCRSHKVADLREFWDGQSEIYLLDQNLLAAPERIELLQQLVDSKALVVFDGGMDVRFVNSDIISLCKRIKVKDFHFAWDDPKENLSNSEKCRKAAWFVLTNAECMFLQTTGLPPNRTCIEYTRCVA